MYLLRQASHDAHGTVLDGIEDRLTSHEIKSAASLVSKECIVAFALHCHSVILWTAAVPTDNCLPASTKCSALVI